MSLRSLLNRGRDRDRDRDRVEEMPPKVPHFVPWEGKAYEGYGEARFPTTPASLPPIIL